MNLETTKGDACSEGRWADARSAAVSLKFAVTAPDIFEVQFVPQPCFFYTWLPCILKCEAARASDDSETIAGLEGEGVAW